jgi:hypothetical protein
MYKNNTNNNEKMMYPQGLLNFELDKNNKYNHKKTLATQKTNTSEINPIAKISIDSMTENLLWVKG